MTLSADRLRKLIKYDPLSGKFIRLVRTSNKIKAGNEAGCIDKRGGYRLISVDNKLYLASRLAWLYMTGEWPKQEIDHANGNPSDDRWLNLREASHQENMCNRGVQKNNILGVKGVSAYAGGRKYRARICYKGTVYRQNGFDSVEEAALAYAEMAKQLHGEFAKT